jgi:alpha/beta superfamily hydrolase
VIEHLTLSTHDGISLDAELARAADTPRAGIALCHPHPLHGGTMQSLVISALFGALPPLGVTCLRFDFRGVGASEGTHDHGDGERYDARAAVDALFDVLPDGVPLVLAGWSFGADVALSVHDAAVRGWFAVAPPLRSAHALDAMAQDPRPKLIVLAENDEVRDPREVEAEVGGWPATSVEVVGGASHFFVGRTDRLVDLAAGFVDALAAP